MLKHHFVVAVVVSVVSVLVCPLGGCTLKQTKTACDVRDLGACDLGEVCDAATKTCVEEKKCLADADCPDNFGCTLNRCRRNCYNAIEQGGLDAACRDGSVCAAESFTCVAASACDPKSTSADLACNGFVCDGASSTCVAPTTCSNDEVCGGYRCNSIAKYCHQSCADDIDCAAGKHCKTNECQ